MITVLILGWLSGFFIGIGLMSFIYAKNKLHTRSNKNDLRY